MISETTQDSKIAPRNGCTSSWVVLRMPSSQQASYYTGLASNLVMFVVGFALAILLPARPRDLRNLTLWTLDKQPRD